jgi:hypothetical protein
MTQREFQSSSTAAELMRTHRRPRSLGSFGLFGQYFADCDLNMDGEATLDELKQAKAADMLPVRGRIRPL